MENFEFCISVNTHFGKGMIKKLSDAVSQYGDNILLVYGGGSIKRNGLYDEIMQEISSCHVFELSGVGANPKVEYVRKGIRLIRENNIDVIVSVGGGSVIDCAKAIAAGTYYDGDVWELISSQEKQAEIHNVVPLIAIPTVAATGSETDTGAVIVNPETKEKLALNSPLLLPKETIIDPTYTFTVPAKQTAAGSADILSHLMEQYFVPKSTILGDLLVESVMKTVIHFTRVAMDEPDNYEARAQLFWSSELADNATLCNGNELVAFSVHGMEHQISGRYDTTHGVGLSILTPVWMSYEIEKNPEVVVPRFAHFGEMVFGVKGTDERQTAELAVSALKKFYQSIGLPETLSDIGVDDKHFSEMAVSSMGEGLAYAYVPLTPKDVEEIYRRAY